MSSVQVEIFGQSYNIKGKDDHTAIRELAAFVDAKMREIQAGTGTADPHRVAILAALTIADELFRLRRQYGDLETRTDQAVKRLLEISVVPDAKAR